jgi:1-hydroxycarotenoid 3,4-desaturase
LKKRHVIVIGAGIGGLTTALDLARRGLRVSVYERSSQPGGKMREVEVSGHPIDSGPTVFTMPWIFESLFADAGARFSDHLSIRPAEVLARHAWQAGGQLDLYPDLDRSAAAIKDLSGADEAHRYVQFSRHAKQVFETLYEPYMLNRRPSPWSLVTHSGWRGLARLWRIHPFETLWRRLGKSFHDPRLRGLFARYATYCGSSPLQAPATLMLIAHVERLGVWQIEGGMHRLARVLTRLIRDLGGTVNFDAGVREIRIQDGRALGIELESGDHVAADGIVANADVAGLQHGNLGSGTASAMARWRHSKRSLSAVTWSMRARTSGFDLSHHNVFFPDSYPQEFRDIFDHGRLPRHPAVYVCAQDRGPGAAGPSGAERLLLIANAPAFGDQCTLDDAASSQLESAVFGLLERCGLTIDRPADACVMTQPANFEAMFPGTGGAIYGAASHGWRASFARPTARSRIRGLYLAGGSVHPGPGVPMVALSGRLAAQTIADDMGLS